MNSFTTFHGGGNLCPNANNRLEKQRSITFGKISKCLSLLLVLFSMSFLGFANNGTSITNPNNTNILADISDPCTSRAWFKNKGCKTIAIFKRQDGRDQHIGTVNPNGTKEVDTYKGQKFTFKVDDKKIKTWTVSSCKNSTQNIDSKGCVTAPCTSKVSFKNTGCKTMEFFKRENNRDQHIGTLKKGESRQVTTYKGQKFTFKVDNKTIKTWTVSSCSNKNQNVDSKGCETAACKSRAWFKNKGCKTISIFKRQDGRDQHIGTVNPNGTKEVDTYKGQKFTFKVDDKTIKTWTVSKCEDSTQNIDSKGCVTAPCTSKVRFKNTGCKTMEFFRRDNNQDQHVGTLKKGESREVTTYKGQKFTFKVDNKTIKTWTVSSCSDRTQNVDSKGCENTPDCKDIKITTSRKEIKISGLKKAPISQVKVVRKKDNKTVFTCHRNCDDTERIKVDEGDYWIKVTYFTSGSKHVCEVSKDVHVKGLASEENAASSRTATPASTTQLATLSPTKAANTTSTTATDNTEIATFGTVSSTLAPVQVSPNPANTTLFVNSSLSGQEGELVLFNQFGQTMKQVDLGALRNGTLQIDISGYQPGLYLMSTRLKSGEIFTEKILIQ